MRNLSLQLILISTLLSSACRDHRDISKPAYILGPTNDIERLNDVDVATISIDAEVLAKAIKASVLVITEGGGRKYCSGSLIGGRKAGGLPRIVTSQHCFAMQSYDRSYMPTLIPEACVLTTVYFDFSTASEPLTRKCKSGSLVTNYDADLAMFSIDAALPADYQPFKIWSSGEVPPNRRAFIIHHPSAKESGQGEESKQKLKSIDAYFPKKAITVNDCRVLGWFEESSWHYNHNLPFSLRHTCDLVRGSAGSGLIDVETGQLLGVNWGGIAINLDEVKSKDNAASAAEFLREFVDSGGVSVASLKLKHIQAYAGDSGDVSDARARGKDFVSCAHLAVPAASLPYLFPFLFMPLLVAFLRRQRLP